MQCPNCGKEALNVNGRFVCLDCGIEISADTQPSSAPAAPPTENLVSNHNSQGFNISAQPPETAPTEDTLPAEDTALESEPVSSPVENEYLSELNNNSETPSEKPAAEGIPDFPIPVSDNVETKEEATTLDTPSSPTVNPAVPTDGNYFQPATVDLTSSAAPVDFSSMAPAVDPVVPVAAPVDADEPTETIVPTEANSVLNENPTDSPLIVTPATEGPSNTSDVTPVQAPLEDASATVAAPSTDVPNPFNQGLNPTDSSIGQANPSGGFSIPVTTSDPVSPVTEAVPSAAAPDSLAPTEAPAAPASNLDDLLNQYAGPAGTPAPGTSALESNFMGAAPAVASVDSVAPSIPTPPSPQAPYAPSPIPGSANIPSTESVFGPQNSAQPVDVPQKAKFDRKKLILFGAIGVIGTLLIAGAIFLGVSLTRSKASSDPTADNEEQLLKYSGLVSNAMDPNQNLVVAFNQSLDFSKSTVKAREGIDQATIDSIKTLFNQTPIVHSGSWSGDTAGNINLDSTLSSVANKKIYIQADKATYALGADGKTWAKVNGYEFLSVPPFYGPVNKGALFYTSKSDEINYLADEELDGASYHKLKIKPKKEVYESLLLASTPTLAAAKIEDINSENIEVFAWIDDSGKIYKVSVVGDLGVTSDIFDGTVSVKSEATYQYKDVSIQKP